MKNFAHIDVSFAASSGASEEDVVTPSQVHGNRIAAVVSGSEDLRDCDGLVTQNRTLKLGVRTADCAAICFGDGTQIGIAHVGWRGLCLGLIEDMLGAFSKGVEVFVGPHIHAFEIRKDFCYDAIYAKFGTRFFFEEKGALLFHFKNAIASRLTESAVFDVRDTFKDNSLPSNRRDGTKDRLITVVQFKHHDA